MHSILSIVCILLDPARRLTLFISDKIALWWCIMIIMGKKIPKILWVVSSNELISHLQHIEMSDIAIFLFQDCYVFAYFISNWLPLSSHVNFYMNVFWRVVQLDKDTSRQDRFLCFAWALWTPSCVLNIRVFLLEISNKNFHQTNF